LTNPQNPTFQKNPTFPGCLRSLAFLASPEFRVFQAYREFLGCQGIPGCLASQEFRVFPVYREFQASPAFPVNPGHPALHLTALARAHRLR